MRYVYDKYEIKNKHESIGLAEGFIGTEYKGPNSMFDPPTTVNYMGEQLPAQQYYNSYARTQQVMQQPLGVNNVAPMNVGISQPNSMEQVYEHMGQQISQNDGFANNAYSLNTYHFVYQVEAKDGDFVLFYGENVVKYLQRTTTRREQNNLKGGLSHTSTIKDKPIEICDPIFFKSVELFQREDKPGKHFCNVFSSANGYNDFLLENKVVEIKDVNGSRFSLILKGEIIRPGQEVLCSIFFRSMINRLAKMNVEIMISSYPGWYRDDKFGWVYLSRDRYMHLKEYEIPEGMNRRTVGRTDRSVNTVYADLKPLIGNNRQIMLLFALRLISSLLIMFKNQGIMPTQIIAPIVVNQEQCSIATALLKTSDLFSLDIISLDKYTGDISKEILESRDGIAVISGPQTAAEAKINGKQARMIRNAAIGANGTDKR